MSESTCPFCSAQIDEQLSLFGGNCPKCFGHIPGEDAATDPGEDVKAEMAKSDARRAQIRAFAPVAIAAPLIGILAIFAIYVLMKPAPTLEVLDFDEIEFAMPELDMLVVADEPETVASESKKTNTRKRSRSKKDIKINSLKMSSSGDEADALASLGGDEEALNTVRATRTGTDAELMPALLSSEKTGSMQTGSQFSSGSNMGAGPLQIRKRRLSEARDIKMMVGGVLRKQLPRLRSCYESRLRADANLKGKWTLTFVVNKEGAVEEAVAKGLDMGDAELERCVTGKMGRWMFSPINNNLPVRKTITFQPR